MSEPETKPQSPTSKSSRISGFFKLSNEERMQKVKEFANLDDSEIELLIKSILFNFRYRSSSTAP